MDEQYIERLILAGAIESWGLDTDTGEFLYRFTDKLKDVDPELYESYLSSIHQEVMFFFERGFLDIDNITSTNPIIKLTDKAFDQKSLELLSKEQYQSFLSIKNVLKVI